MTSCRLQTAVRARRATAESYLRGRAPITTGTYLRFCEGGGYVRREWWSDEGWSWKEQYDISRTAGWSDRPHVEGSPQPFHRSRPMAVN